MIDRIPELESLVQKTWAELAEVYKSYPATSTHDPADWCETWEEHYEYPVLFKHWCAWLGIPKYKSWSDREKTTPEQGQIMTYLYNRIREIMRPLAIAHNEQCVLYELHAKYDWGKPEDKLSPRDFIMKVRESDFEIQWEPDLS